MPNSDYLSNTQARIELLGMPSNLDPFAQFTSSPRAGMYSHHLAQAMVLNEPEFNHLFTGDEYKMMDYTINPSRREYDCEIVAAIPKYNPAFLRGGLDDCPEIFVIVLNHLPNGTRQLDYFMVNRYFMGLNGFGFIPRIQNMRFLNPGEFLLKDMPITHSPRVNGNEYSLGLNLRTVFASFPETVEDAFVISKSAAELLQTTQVSEVVVDCRPDWQPLNLHGDEYVDKFLPDIGSSVGPEGLLCAHRPVHWSTYLADTDKEALRELMPLQDDPKYIAPNAKIVDLTFNVNNRKINNCYSQALNYMNENTKSWRAIYDYYTKYSGKPGISVSNKMATLAKTAIYRMIAQGASIPALEKISEFRRARKRFQLEGENYQLIDFLQVVVHYTVPRPVSIGTKLTDRCGARLQ